MLGDLRVLDITEDLGLMCGQLLADMGADVHQLVRPGLAGRLAGPHWQAYTRGKRIEVIDWPEAPRVIEGFAAEADVLLESCGPAPLAALGLDKERLQHSNPGLIQVSITPFGGDGPKAGYAATDLTIAAASGHVLLSGPLDGAPVRISADQAHAHAAADAAVGVLIALAERERSGRGQHLDISAQQSMTLALLNRSLDKPCGHPKAERMAYALKLGEVPVKTQFRCADGWVVVLQGILPPLAGFMERLMAWVSEAGLCDAQHLQWDWGNSGARMMAGQISAADWAPIEKGIERLVAGQTKARLMQEAVARRLLLAPVFEVQDLLQSQHLAQRNCVVKARNGAQRLGAFAKFSRTPLPLRPLTAAATGQRNQQALRNQPTAKPPAAASPLAGVKILDLFWVVAGPGATRMLADYGATVVHVETRKKVDMLRNVPPYVGGQMHPERAAAHHSTNANKLNITLDATTAAGKEVLRDLVAWADVFTESFAPGTIERLGFGYQQAAAINPQVIMISSTLMGQTGPWRDYAGYGNLAAAVCGFHALTGHVGEPPTGCYGPYTDFTSVRFNALAILLALRERVRTGRGQYIDMAQAEAALHFLAPACMDYWRSGETPRAQGNRDWRYAPQGLYQVRGDDRWLALSIRSDSEWRELCDLSGVAALAKTRGWPCEQRRSRHDELDEHLAAWLKDRDGAQVERALQDANIPAHRVLDTYDLFAEPQLNHRRHFLWTHHQTFGKVCIESSRLRFSRSQPKAAATAPHFGSDNQAVLEQILGYDAGRIAGLQQAGALN